MDRKNTESYTLLIGPKSPPPTGQSVAFDMLIEGLSGMRRFEMVDLAERNVRRDAQFSLNRALSMLGIIWDVWRKSRKCQVVYLQIAQSRWGFIRDAIIILIARINRCRVVAHLHGGGYAEFYSSLPPPIRGLIRFTLRHIDRLIVLSDGLRSNFAFMGEDYVERLRVVPNATPVPIGAPKQAPHESLRLLYLSNLLVEKGYFDCIDALPHIQRMLPDTKIELVLAGAFLLGADDYDSVEALMIETRKRVRYMGLEKHVRFAGVVTDDKKVALLDESDLLLLPSYYRNEGQPISVIEGLARGTPVIVTAWRGIPEILGTKECGTIVPVMTPIAIAEAAVELFRDKDKYEQYSKNACARAEHFAVERYVSNLVGVCDEMLVQ